MDSQKKIEAFWNDFLDTLPNRQSFPSELPEAWGFGDSPEMAEELGRLVLNGIKTATCSAVWEYEAENESVPQVGDLSIVTDGREQPLCIIETIEVTIKAYNEVEAQFAYEEGEGDRSLAYWRQAHHDFFSRMLPIIGRQFSETMPLICERFRVIYPQAS
ncbi:MAG: ASCH domain-containing protein [Candidatus Promineifilaceae bacterium]